MAKPKPHGSWTIPTAVASDIASISLSKKAADAFRVHVEGQLQAGTYRSDADKMTVKEVCESFLEHCSGRYDRDERMTRKMLRSTKGT